MQIFEVSFDVYQDPPDGDTKTKWRSRVPRSYAKVFVAAESLSQLLSTGTSKLLETFPYDDGQGGSHYSTDPSYGNRLEFTDIRRTHSKVNDLR